jgi:hypothetical protein
MKNKRSYFTNLEATTSGSGRGLGSTFESISWLRHTTVDWSASAVERRGAWPQPLAQESPWAAPVLSLRPPGNGKPRRGCARFWGAAGRQRTFQVQSFQATAFGGGN